MGDARHHKKNKFAFADSVLSDVLLSPDTKYTYSQSVITHFKVTTLFSVFVLIA